jgi:hypothetical protein
MYIVRIVDKIAVSQVNELVKCSLLSIHKIYLYKK